MDSGPCAQTNALHSVHSSPKEKKRTHQFDATTNAASTHRQAPRACCCELGGDSSERLLASIAVGDSAGPAPAARAVRAAHTAVSNMRRVTGGSRASRRC